MEVKILSKNQIKRLTEICRCKHHVINIGITKKSELMVEFTEWNGEIKMEIIPFNNYSVELIKT